MVVTQVLELAGLAVADPGGELPVADGDGGAFGGKPVTAGVAVSAGVERGPASQLPGGGNRCGEVRGPATCVGPSEQDRGGFGESANLGTQGPAADLVVHRSVQGGDGLDTVDVASTDTSTR